MKYVPASYLAWSLWAVFVGIAVALVLVIHFLVPSISQDSFAVDTLFMVAAGAMVTTGTIVASRYPDNFIGWLLLSIGLTLVIAGVAESYGQYALQVRPGALPGGVLAALVPWALLISFFGQLVLLTLLFPSGTLLSARWRRVSWGLVGALVTFAASSSLGPELELLQPPIRNPIAIAGAEGILNVIETTALVAMMLLLVAATVSLVLRFIRSIGEERQQIKWFAYAAGVFGTYMVISVFLEITGNAPPRFGGWSPVRRLSHAYASGHSSGHTQIPPV